MDKVMKLHLLAAVLVFALIFAILLAQGPNLALVINGKAVAGKTAVLKGQTYVPVTALKAAGAKVSAQGGKLTIAFPAAVAPGGANQVAAYEGGVNEWLFNGMWRFRVSGIAPLEGERPGWKVAVELRNGTKLDNFALAGSGFDSLTLVMADGIALRPYNITAIADRPIGQGASVAIDLIFYDDEGAGRKPDKLILRIAPDDLTRKFLKDQGAAYAGPDPSFRVRLAPPGATAPPGHP
jgi:hypothetical protein